MLSSNSSLLPSLNLAKVYCCACYFFNYLGMLPNKSTLNVLSNNLQIVKLLQMPMYVCINRADHTFVHTCKVAGMREDLNLKGNQFSILISLFTAG